MLQYRLRRSPRRRSLEIRILAESAQIAVAAPTHLSLEKIQAFVLRHADYIVRKQNQLQERLARLPSRQYENGQLFLFLGAEYPLAVARGAGRLAQIEFDGQGWSVCLPADSSKPPADLIKKKLVRWYREQAQEVFGGRIFHFARILGENPTTIAVKTQKRMWGNCDCRARRINLNWRLVLAPLAVIDYVVVHELCHLRVPNHSKKFWAEVAKVLPYYKNERDWLRKNGSLLSLP